MPNAGRGVNDVYPSYHAITCQSALGVAVMTAGTELALAPIEADDALGLARNVMRKWAVATAPATIPVRAAFTAQGAAKRNTKRTSIGRNHLLESVPIRRSVQASCLIVVKFSQAFSRAHSANLHWRPSSAFPSKPAATDCRGAQSRSGLLRKR